MSHVFEDVFVFAFAFAYVFAVVSAFIMCKKNNTEMNAGITSMCALIATRRFQSSHSRTVNYTIVNNVHIKRFSRVTAGGRVRAISSG